MIRVGFVLSSTYNGWLGGLNYLSNLLHAIHHIGERRIEPVLFVGTEAPQTLLDHFPAVPIVRTRLADSSDPVVRAIRKIPERAMGCDFALTRLLRRHGIDVLSHSGQLGSRSRLHTVGWIPDFQHRRMPEFFQVPERAALEQAFHRIADQCTTVVVSSEDAQRDMAAFSPAAVSRSRVLKFVSGLAAGAVASTDEATLRLRYSVDGPYFHLPNQFWLHKNHGVVIEALTVLRARGHRATVLATGATQDRRQPGHFHALMAQAEKQGVAEMFRALGVVPRADLIGLMRHSVGVINPSLFEGWSTTVEESRSLGLTVVLSDIPVHREQAPEHGIYFGPRDPKTLADIMTAVEGRSSSVESQDRQAAASAALPERFRLFGEAYQAIVFDTLSRKAAH